MSGLKITGSVESLHLEPGDTLVVTLDIDSLDIFKDWIDASRDVLKEKFPDNEIVFLSQGMTLSKVAA